MSVLALLPNRDATICLLLSAANPYYDEKDIYAVLPMNLADVFLAIWPNHLAMEKYLESRKELNVPGLRGIFVRIQGTTRNSGEKTSKTVRFILSETLTTYKRDFNAYRWKDRKPFKNLLFFSTSLLDAI